MLAQHAYISLELEKSLKTIENSSNYIQYANELWASTVFLSKTIATKSRETFANLSIDSTLVLAEAISAVYLLEQITLKDLFQEFLTSRTVFIRIFLNLKNIIICLFKLKNKITHKCSFSKACNKLCVGS